MSDIIDVRISPTLHPGITGEIADYDDYTRPLLGATETAVDEAFKALQSIHDAKAGAEKNPTWNDAARLVATDSHATKVMSKVYGSWSRTVDTLDANITKLEGELNAPVEQRATASMASEIRSYFRSLDPGPRMNALRQAIEAGDDTTVTAVLGGRPYLSGLEPDLHAEFLHDWHNAQRPVDAKKLRAMKAAAEMLNNRYKLLTKAVTEAVGDIKVYEPSKVDGRPVLFKTITPAQVRKQVKESNEAFAIPV
ncbi:MULTISPECIES: hypothetical protein [unclassified Sphingomonas]|uniref:hypothetical protein n=1 Tax=unclassified Sphingomonas TaxID=196159 RepID=UPI000700DE23|nr:MULTISPECIES: hypothetical protein [unclassified Sphingomonas]KQM27326.1 hypothetical protein ASE58_10335 [Sphingomonas sp. Leaf9]KQM43663.1 hypothetical protein ASE57_10340 [Sphingomonas sp. Leaf11]